MCGLKNPGHVATCCIQGQKTPIQINPSLVMPGENIWLQPLVIFSQWAYQMNCLFCSDSDPIINTARPASSANPSLKMSNRPISVKLTQQRSTRSGLIRLAPIDNRSKTPNVVRVLPLDIASFHFLLCLQWFADFHAYHVFHLLSLSERRNTEWVFILSSHFYMSLVRGCIRPT